MACYSLRDGGKRIGFICGDFGEPCRECGSIAENLCDYPVGEGKTCDRPICEEHSRRVGVDIHYCPTHARQWDQWRKGGGVERELKNVVPFEGA